MSLSHFRRIAAQSYRRARASFERHKDYEALMRLGQEFKAKATRAAARLARMRGAAGTRQGLGDQDTHQGGRR